MKIIVGARSSALSRTQVQEVLHEMHTHHPSLEFASLFVETFGDKDRTTSLRTLGQTDFFTREVDELLLSKKCRIAIHSAKDLPSPLHEQLSLVALTRGVDPADVLVLRKGESLQSLPRQATIATSSVRREEAVRQLRADLHFIDLRGTIEERLALLDIGKADGVVVAEAALIRLGLTHLNRIPLPGATIPGQGRLAILARRDDEEMCLLFAAIDARP